VLTSMYGKHQVDTGKIDNDHYNHIKYAQFVGNENAITGATKMLGISTREAPKFASKLRFELYESQGDHYVKTTYNDEPVNLGGSGDGIMSYDSFMNHIYRQLYFGNTNNYCRGQENIASNLNPSYSTYEEYLKSRNTEFRVSETKASSSRQSSTQTETTLRSSSKDEGWMKQDFVEIEQVHSKPQPRVVEVVEPMIIERPRVAMAERRVVQPRMEQQYVERSAPVRSSHMTQAPHASRQVSRSAQYGSAQIQESSAQARVVDVEFKKIPGWDRKPKNKCITNEKYDPRKTHECDVNIPFLHPVELPQVIHDRQVVVVPEVRVEEKVRVQVQEKLVTEKPTEIHHIKLDGEAPPMGAPHMFAETIEEESGWPWWYWLPLLALCCLIPLCLA
jgi:hypothetical protein